MGLAEVNINWNKVAEEHRLPARYRGHFKPGQLAFTHAHNKHDKISGTFQYGGTASITTGETVGRLDGPAGRDPTGMGRFTWHKLRGKGGLTLRILTFYRPCKPSSQGITTAYAQQTSHMNSIGRIQCPRNAIMEDIKILVKKWKNEGEQVIVMGDLNEYIQKNSSVTFFNDIGMRELITERHGTKGPATTLSNKSQEAVDGIWGTLGVQILAGGYLPFYEGIESDHRLLWVKLHLTHIFGNPEPPIKRPKMRTLNLDDIKACSTYKRHVRQYEKKHRVKERMTEIVNNMTFPATADQIVEFEKIDAIRMEARRYGIKKCKKMYVSGIASSKPIKKVRLKIRLIDLILERNSGDTGIKWRTISTLAKSTKENKILLLTDAELLVERRKIRKEFYELKKKAKKIRSTVIEEKAQEMEEKGEEEEAKRLHQLLATEIERERAARLKRLRATENRKGVTAVRIESQSINNEGKMIKVEEEITNQQELEKECMKEVDRRSRMSENTPPMTAPLVDHLLYTSNTDYADKILEGTAPKLPGVDEHTQLYLDQLKSVDGEINPVAKPVDFHEYTKEVSKLQEKTSSGPSVVSPAMIKTECTDKYLSAVNWMASNFPWCTGYSPERFRKGVDLLIHKKANDNRITKLRPILLFDLECNMHNKRLGREAMRMAEDNGGIAREQYGSRKRKSAEIQALNTRLFYDYALLKRHSGVSTFIDLVSNYDLVVHSIATLALRRVGMPTAPIFCTFSTLQDMVHSVRTAYGDSLDSYGGELWVIKQKPPPQGLGQGNGSASSGWALVSTPLLNALRDKGYGVVFKCAISRGKFKLVGYCFVDDSTIVQLAPNPNTTTAQMVQKAQDELDLYVGLARATGGQVSQEKNKNSWYLIEFQWDKKGEWKLSHNSGDIYVNSNGKRTKVERIPTNVASRILGVWIAPNGDNKQQVKELKTITETWADRVRSGHIKIRDAWHYYQTTVQKSLEYPLLATTIDEKDCKKIEWPALKVALQSAALPSNFPQDVLYGPTDHLGQGASRIFTTQGIKHIRALMDHGSLDSITGEQLRAIIEIHKVELGTRNDFFSNNYEIFKFCSTNTWISWTWKFMHKHRCIVKEETPNLRTHRENDKMIMEALAEKGIQGKELAMLNRCRMFLQITTLSDITTADGNTIVDQVLDGRKCIKFTPYEWPVQGNLSRTHWKKWREAISSAFELGRNNRLPPEHRLGRWTDSNHETGWRYSASEDRIYEYYNNTWTSHRPIIERRGKLAHRRFELDGSECALPEDAEVTICTLNKRAITTTGTSTTIKNRSAPETNTIQHLIQTANASSQWALADLKYEEEAQYIAEAIEKHEAIAVSDGSYKNSRSAAGCVLEGKIPGHKRVTAKATSPGHLSIQDAYRGELTGLYMIVRIVLLICQRFQIKNGGITVACDGIEALKKGFDVETHYSCRSNQFDLISAIRNMIKKSPIEWKWQHVKGHQDDHYGPLDRWSTLNVEMDTEAKARRDHDEANNPPIQHEIEHEMWKLFTGVPETTKTTLPSSHKVSTEIDNELKELLEGRKIVKYWTNHHIIPPTAVKKIDWTAIGKAREKKNFHQKKWATKWAAERIPVGCEMQDRGCWKSATCPRGCGEEMETAEHVITCKKANKLWEKIKAILEEWATNSEAKPGLIKAFISGLEQWRNGEEVTLTTNSDPAIAVAFAEQTKIGWDAAMKGFLSKKWQEIQELHFKHIKSRRSSLRFIASLINKLFDVSWDFWQHRNHALQMQNAANGKDDIARLRANIIEQYHKGGQDLPDNVLFLLKLPICQLLRKSLRTQLSWLEAIAHARMRKRVNNKEFRKENDKDLQLIQQFLKSGILRRKKSRLNKVPTLRTTVDTYHKTWKCIERDINEDNFEEEHFTSGEDMELGDYEGPVE